MNLLEVVKKIGFQSFVCPNCGEKTPLKEAFFDLFREIKTLCLSGEEVRIKSFGIFRKSIIPSREIIWKQSWVKTRAFESVRFYPSRALRRAKKEKG